MNEMNVRIHGIVEQEEGEGERRLKEVGPAGRAGASNIRKTEV